MIYLRSHARNKARFDYVFRPKRKLHFDTICECEYSNSVKQSEYLLPFKIQDFTVQINSFFSDNIPAVTKTYVSKERKSKLLQIK